MFGYDLDLIAIMTAALIIGGIVKGVVAIGLPIVTIAILLNFMPPKTVLAIVVLPIVITNLWQAARAGNLMEPLRRFWAMTAGFVIFLFVGCCSGCWGPASPSLRPRAWSGPAPTRLIRGRKNGWGRCPGPWAGCWAAFRPSGGRR